MDHCWFDHSWQFLPVNPQSEQSFYGEFKANEARSSRHNLAHQTPTGKTQVLFKRWHHHNKSPSITMVSMVNVAFWNFFTTNHHSLGRNPAPPTGWLKHVFFPADDKHGLTIYIHLSSGGISGIHPSAWGLHLHPSTKKVARWSPKICWKTSEVSAVRKLATSAWPAKNCGCKQHKEVDLTILYNFNMI